MPSMISKSVPDVSSIFTETGRRLRRNGKYVKGMFYNILAGYYDCVINGEYYNEDRIEEIDKMLNAINKAIRYMKRDRGKYADLYAILMNSQAFSTSVWAAANAPRSS